MTTYALPLEDRGRRLGVLGIDLTLDLPLRPRLRIRRDGGVLRLHRLLGRAPPRPCEASGTRRQADLGDRGARSPGRAREGRGRGDGALHRLGRLHPRAFARRDARRREALGSSASQSPSRRSSADRDRVLRSLAVLFAFGLLAMGFSVYVVASRVTKPLASFGEAFALMEKGDLRTRVARRGSGRGGRPLGQLQPPVGAPRGPPRLGARGGRGYRDGGRRDRGLRHAHERGDSRNPGQDRDERRRDWQAIGRGGGCPRPVGWHTRGHRRAGQGHRRPIERA